MKARKFWAIYIPLIALGLGSFYISSGSLAEVPLVLSDVEMQETIGGSRSNAKCITRTGCYPNSSGCSGNTRYSGSLSWKDCTSASGKKCNPDYNSTRRVCHVRYYTGGGCAGEYSSSNRNRPKWCSTSGM